MTNIQDDTRKANFEKLIKVVAQHTNSNDHTGARIAISKFFGLGWYIGIFELIEQIQRMEQKMPKLIGEYRDHQTEAMLKFLLGTYVTEEELDDLRSAL